MGKLTDERLRRAVVQSMSSRVDVGSRLQGTHEEISDALQAWFKRMEARRR
jgi:hypothetical protein